MIIIKTKTHTYLVDEKMDPIKLLQKHKNSFVSGNIDGKEYTSYDGMYNALLEYLMKKNAENVRAIKKLQEAKKEAAKTAATQITLLITREKYSPQLHTEVQKAYGCRFYDVEVAHSVASEVQYRQGSSREELLYLLGILKVDIRVGENVYDSVYSEMVKYMALIPSINAGYTITIKDIVFDKLNRIHELLDQIRVVKEEDLIRVAEEIDIPLDDLIQKKIYIPLDRHIPDAKGYYLYIPEGYWDGLLYGVEVDWKKLLKRKLERKRIYQQKLKT